MKSIFTVIGLALAFVTPAFAGIEWGFNSSATDLTGTSLGSSGSGIAAINLGTFGTGWHSGTSVPWNTFGGAAGLWDVGSAGSIVLNNLTGSGLTTLNVFQWVQPGGTLNNPYNGGLSVSVNGGQSITLTPIIAVTGAGWYEYTANLGSVIPGDITITASAGGAIIDRLTLVPEPATMIAGAVLLIPFALSTIPILRRRRTTS